MWQKDCMVKSAEKPRQAKSLSSSRVIGPVVSCEPTVVIFGSQYCPGRTPGMLQARPTIFCASVKPLPESVMIFGLRKISSGSIPNEARALSVRPRPTISGIRPPARTSSRITSDLSSKVLITSSVPWRFTTPSYG